MFVTSQTNYVWVMNEKTMLELCFILFSWVSPGPEHHSLKLLLSLSIYWVQYNNYYYKKWSQFSRSPFIFIITTYFDWIEYKLYFCEIGACKHLMLADAWIVLIKQCSDSCAVCTQKMISRKINCKAIELHWSKNKFELIFETYDSNM